ncbi:hypothetical protein HQ544_01150 [Candidatus Falkowbacteria bacterium]|nr:hypothetical protein [Candidatus Falkowbacteria bacterium]
MNKKKVAFTATKKISTRKNISFTTKEGPVNFWATKKVPKKTKVRFYTKPKRVSKGTASRALR